MIKLFFPTARTRVLLAIAFVVVASLANLRMLRNLRKPLISREEWNAAKYDALLKPVCEMLPPNTKFGLEQRDKSSERHDLAYMLRYGVAPRQILRKPPPECEWWIVCDDPASIQPLSKNHQLVMDLGGGIRLCRTVQR